MTPIIKVTDVAYVRLRAPDLDQAETFLTDFGMTRTGRTDDALYMRGTDADHHCHITELGEPAFIGFGLNVASNADLHTLAEADDASPVEDIDEPGGGQRVTLTDPDGFRIDVVHGIERLPDVPLENHFDWNYGTERRRLGELLRLERKPAQVKRLGHIVFHVTNFNRSDEFYASHFGFLHSDEMYTDDENETVTAFIRCDKGDDFVDHHTLLLVPGEEAGFNHAAFEVEDLNAVYLGHEFLRDKEQYEHQWGIGRHILGSQIFDYWKNPWGQVHEHWTDGDLLNAQTPVGRTHRSEALNIQWGPQAPFRPGA